MKVTCDRCHKEFNNLLKEETKTIEGQEVIHTFLRCSHCGMVYTVGYDSPSTLVLKKQIRRHTATLQTIRDVHRYKRKLKDIEKKQKRLEREMKILQSKYSSYFEEERKG